MAAEVDLDGDGGGGRRRRRGRRGGGGRKWIGGLITLAVLLGVVYLLYAIGVLAPVLRMVGVGDSRVVQVIEEPTFYDLPQTIIQISTNKRAAQLMRVTIRLNLARRSDVRLIESDIPLLVNEMQTILRQLRIDDLQDRNTRSELRKLLIKRFSELVPLAKIRDLLFKEVMIQ